MVSYFDFVNLYGEKSAKDLCKTLEILAANKPNFNSAVIPLKTSDRFQRAFNAVCGV